MRRFIAYIITALAMLLAIGVAATPVVAKLNSGREFTSGRDYREITFRIEGGNEDEDKASVVAKEMRERLDNYNVEDYSVKIQDKDTVAVALALDSKEYNYAAKYLCFSGESFALVSSNGKPESVRNENPLFNPDDIRIEYSKDGANVPIIVIPTTEAGREDVKALIQEFESSDSSDTTKAITRAAGDEEEGGEEEKPKNYLYLWSNFDDDRGEELASLEKDPVAREKVLMAFNADDIWYSESKEKAKETELYYMCATATSDNQLDISGLKDDNARANYLVNMLKAKKYNYTITCPTANVSKSSMSIDYYENARVLTASAESLLNYTNNVYIKMSKTFIALSIALVIVSLLLVVYYRVNAIAIIATTAGTLFLTLVSFSTMQVLFNIPAVIGFVILSAGVLFGEIAYVNRFKEEVYKGRSIKKANQEASRKSNLITLDSSIILAFSGLMMYALGGAALKPMGVVLFFGAVFALLMNLLIFKLLMYLVTNTTSLQTKYNVFNIDEEKVPNLLSVEDKSTYEAPYEKVNFTKKKSIISIIFGALFAGALTCIIVFGVKGPSYSPLNVENATSDQTVIYTAVEYEGNEKPLVSDAASFVQYVLPEDYQKIDNVVNDVECKKVEKYVYNSDEDSKTETYYYFTLYVNKTLTSTERETLEDTLNNNLFTLYPSRDDSKTYSLVKNSKELVYTPNQGLVALATGIAIAGVSLYFAFRFRPSRGIATLVTVTGTTAIAYGAFVAMRFIGTTAVTSLAMPVVAVSMMLASLFYLSTEKALRKEGHLELTPELRKEIMVKAIGKSASALFVFMLINIYVLINFFGFGVDLTAILFASAILGEVVAVVALLSILGPLADVIERGLRKIHLPKIKWFSKEKPKQVAKRNSSEPEETIFIGIND